MAHVQVDPDPTLRVRPHKVKFGQNPPLLLFYRLIMHETTSAYLMKENSSENARGKTQCGHNSGLASANQRVSAFVLEL
ncbi:hypothetical protein HMPREF2909_08575 [Alloscardovia sp. HMSC034E08]|nr:hypothetical protein HMPREF2909_08575 [Alloscardovia sp. HMSC034E08]